MNDFDSAWFEASAPRRRHPPSAVRRPQITRIAKIRRPRSSSLLIGCVLMSCSAGTIVAAGQEANVVVEGNRLSADALSTTLRETEVASISEQSFEGLTERVANLHVNSGGAGSYGDLLTLRGLTNTPYFSDPAVTVYLDDIPLGGGFAYPTGLYGFFDAAIRRGSQGTSLGRSGPAGVMLLSSGDLSLEQTPSLSATVGGGSFDARVASVMARSTGDEPLAGSFAASYSARDGFIRNATLDTRVDDQESLTLATRARWRPSDVADITLQLLGNRQRNGAQPLVPLAGSHFTVERAEEGVTNIDFYGVALKGEFDTSVGRLTSVTSHTQWSMDPYTNHVVLPPALDAEVYQRQRAWNEELRLASTAGRVSSLLGAWFSDSRTQGEVTRSLTGLFPIEASTFDLGTRTLAVFGEASVRAADRWLLTAGVRAERTHREFERAEAIPLVQRFADEATFDALLPKLVLRYDLSAATYITATLARSTKPGGWSAYTGNAALADFDQENTNSLELAIASDLVPSVLSLTARGFVYDIRDYQIERSFNFSDYLVVNAPQARSIGAEIEGEWRVLTGLTIAAGLGISHATLRDFTDPFTGMNYSGKRAPYAPAYDASLSMTYQRTSGWFAAAHVGIVGRTYYDEAETELFSQASRTTASARVGFRTDRWRVMLYGENLNDERYYTMIVPGIAHGVPGAPRSWGVELSSSLH